MNSPEVYGIGAIAVSVIGILFWVVKWAFSKGEILLEDLSKSIEANTKVTNENLAYLKNKNGQMEECFTDVMTRLEGMTGNQERIADKLKDVENDIKG